MTMKQKLMVITSALALVAIGACVVGLMRRNVAEDGVGRPVARVLLEIKPAQQKPAPSEVDLSDLCGLDKILPPLLEAMADLKAREPVQLARELSAVLKKYGVSLSSRLRELDERAFQPLASF